jgi:AcrR family transcriptional regulator
MSTQAPPVGRRARKKAAIRQALSDTAVRLFIARGFDAVTLREIADAVDVSTTTLMKHFPSKEALIFDRDDEIERDLIAAVTARPAQTALLDSLRACLRARAAHIVPDRVTQFMQLVLATPALSDYWRKMWMRHEHVLARALAHDLGRRADDLGCRTMAHFVLEAAALSLQSRAPGRTIDVAFDILEHGWPRAASPRKAARKPKR